MRYSRTAIWGLAVASIAFRALAHDAPLKPFTVPEGIALWQFQEWGVPSPPMVSPNRRFVAIWAERGLLSSNLLRDELRVYRMAALERFVSHPRQTRVPVPIFDLREATYKQGPIISHIRWLPNSSGLAFLLRSAKGNYQLAVLNLKKSRLGVLSLDGQNVTSFAVRDATDYAYTVVSLGRDRRLVGRSAWIVRDVTGQGLIPLLFPAEVRHILPEATNQARSILWAAIGDSPHPVVSSETHQPVVVYYGGENFALSPDGQTLAIALAVPEVPRSWVAEFPPASPHFVNRIRAGRQNLEYSSGGLSFVSEYDLINLRTGKITPVNGTPTGFTSGWMTFAAPAWSRDGKALLLPGAYLGHARVTGRTNRPCAAIFYLKMRTMQCVEPLRSGYTKTGQKTAYFYLTQLGFRGDDSDEVMLRFARPSGPDIVKLLVHNAAGSWRAVRQKKVSGDQEPGLDVYIKEGINDAPMLVARDPRTMISRVIWDPNPQLNHIALGKATVYHWKDASGRTWTGGLYMPPSYVAGRRYPLVIQTHGFDRGAFRPSGIYPTAFAARALAASGMMVLQVPFCPFELNPEAGPCAVASYEAAVSKLASQGMINPDRIGIIGFSYSMYDVLECLTFSKISIAAALVSGGDDYSYWQYLELADSRWGKYPEQLNGAKPFGAGLGLWVKRSPTFNMQNVHAPLMVVGLGSSDLLNMWGTYASLRYQGKPVDAELLNSDEHVLTEPGVRAASQGGSVEWFRFWLQGYESIHPVMPDEYRRWERLCDMQKEENPGRTTWCVPTKGFRAQHSKPVRPAAN